MQEMPWEIIKLTVTANISPYDNFVEYRIEVFLFFFSCHIS